MTLFDRARASGLNRLTIALLTAALLLAFLHHADHALRVDHSGWPFRPMVTPFTYSLLAYPVILFALFGPARLYWLRFALLAGATGFTLYAHSAVESPLMQFTMWAENRSLDQPGDLHNALNVTSPALGVAAMVVSMALNLVALVATVSMGIQGLRRRPVG